MRLRRPTRVDAGRRVRRLVPAAAVAALAMVAVGITAVAGPSGAPERAAGATAGPSSGSTAGASSGAPVASSPVSPSAEPVATAPGAPATGATGAVDSPPPALPAVGTRDAVEVEGLRTSLSSLEAIEGEARGPGNVNGPAVRVGVRITNGTDADLDVSGASVTVAHGPGATPASPIEDRSQAPFAGVLAPGETAGGVYVFGVPAGERDELRVEVAPRAGGPLAVFTGGVR